MHPIIWLIEYLPVLLLAGMVSLLELGRRIGIRAAQKKGTVSGAGAIEGAIFALLGLLIAFTFSGAAQRFDVRRAQIVEEANDIGTAWLRIDMLPEADQPEMRKLFRAYLDSRLETYRVLPDIDAAKKELAHSVTLQNEIWRLAVRACKNTAPNPPTMLVLPALNAMFDITTTRAMTMQFHPPGIIYVLLVVLSLFSATLAGYNMAGSKRSWLHILGYAAAMSIAVYTILDLEYPRLGLIRIGAADQVLYDLRQSMN